MICVNELPAPQIRNYMDWIAHPACSAGKRHDSRGKTVRKRPGFAPGTLQSAMRRCSSRTVMGHEVPFSRSPATIAAAAIAHGGAAF